MTVRRGIARLIDILQCIHRPAREVLAAVRGDAGDRVHIRPVTAPPRIECDKRTIRNRAVLRLVRLDVLHCHRIVHIARDLLGDVDHTQRIEHVARTEVLREREVAHEMSRKVNVRPELPRELERLDEAVEHRIAPVKARL